MQPFVFGAVSGIIEVIVTQPLDSYKISKQVGSPYKPFSGIMPRLVGILPMRTVFWGTMLTFDNYNPYVSGALAGFAQTLIETPVEVLKIRQQTNTQRPLFSGFIPHVARNIGFATCVSASMPYAPIGAIIGTTTTHWLDVLKTAQQSGTTKKTLWTGWTTRTVQACVGMTCALVARTWIHDWDV